MTKDDMMLESGRIYENEALAMTRDAAFARMQRVTDEIFYVREIGGGMDAMWETIAKQRQLLQAMVSAYHAGPITDEMYRAWSAAESYLNG